MRYYLSILFFFWATSLVAQTSCSCPTIYSTPISTFNLSGKTQLALCGLTNVDFWTKEFDQEVYIGYISSCRDKEKLYEFEESIVEKKKDTLIIKSLRQLTFGQKKALIWKPLFSTLIFSAQDSIFIEEGIIVSNKDYYSKREIKRIIKQYKSAIKNPYKLTAFESLYICHQLLWCYISGENTASQYLISAKNNLRPLYDENSYQKLITIYKKYTQINIR